MASRPRGTLNEGSGMTVSRLVAVLEPLVLLFRICNCRHGPYYSVRSWHLLEILNTPQKSVMCNTWHMVCCELQLSCIVSKYASTRLFIALSSDVAPLSPCCMVSLCDVTMPTAQQSSLTFYKVPNAHSARHGDRPTDHFVCYSRRLDAQAQAHCQLHAVSCVRF